MTGAQYFAVAAVAVTAVAAVTDWRKGQIPAWLTLGTLAAAPVLHAIAGGVARGKAGALHDLIWSLAGAAICGIVPLILYRMGAMFGGDVKLLIALGALCFPGLGIEAQFYAFVAAALYAPARMAYEGKLMRTLGNMLAILINPFLPKERRRALTPEMMTMLRFGPAVFAGMTVAALLNWRGL